MKNFFTSVQYLVFVWPFGIVLGILFCLWRFLGIIKIKGTENFPRAESKILLVSNHPSLLEPFALIAIFFPQYFFHPFKFGPWNMPDRNNFGGIFRIFGPRLIVVDRGNRRAEVKAILQAVNVLNSGSPIIIFPEGGRTGSGGECERLTSLKGSKIRRFKNGVGLLALKTEALVQPVWVEGTDKIMPRAKRGLFSFPRFWRQFSITLGRPIRFGSDLCSEEITEILEKVILELSEHE